MQNVTNAENILNVEIEFKNLIQSGNNWKSIQDKLVMTKYEDEKLSINAKNDMAALVRYRDLLDFEIYRQAAEKLFPCEHYNLEPRTNGQVEKKDGEYHYKSEWHEFVITSRSLAASPWGQCVIRIDAPGSRKLTSDIDTSIYTKFVHQENFDFTHVADRVKKGIDKASRITNGIIDGFYLISEEIHNVTSSQSRNSNAYVDTLVADAGDYSKFTSNEENNPKIGEISLFTNEEYIELFKEYKSNKTILERAASLFSLKNSFSNNEKWNSFKMQVNNASQEIVEEHIKDDEKKRIFLAEVKKNNELMFEMVENLCGKHQELLERKILEIDKTEYATNSPFLQCGNEKGYKKDIEIAAMNRLYVEQLEKIADIRDKVIGLEKENKGYIEDLRARKPILEQENAKLKKWEEELITYKEDKELQSFLAIKCNKCVELNKEYEERKSILKNNLIEIAKLKNAKQELLIVANTFANEAYVNRSAVYHVVKGMQKKEKINLTEHTLLCSALQQVGFKLLYSQEQIDSRKPLEEVAYLTAKYGYRIFNLIFTGLDDVSDREWEILKKGNAIDKFKLFNHLKSEPTIKNYLYQTLSVEERVLLAYQARIISQVKNKNEIEDSQKSLKTKELMAELGRYFKLSIDNEDFLRLFAEKEKEFFLSIAAKLVGIVYVSRLVRKERLWGKLIKQEPIAQNKETEAPAIENLSIANKQINQSSILPQQGAHIGNTTGKALYSFNAGSEKGHASIVDSNAQDGAAMAFNLVGTSDELTAKALEKIPAPKP